MVKLGVAPIGKFVFSHADALVQKRLVEERLRAWKVPFVNVDGALKDGMVRSQADVGPAVASLREQGAEALFLPHCNFGTEGAAGMIARTLGLPVLLWGPRDGAPEADGTRLRDTLCGLFATSKVLRKLGVPFSYIENCGPDEPAFAEGVERFLRAASVARRFRNLRIGQIGSRIDFFWTTIVNESELLERFGIEILPLDIIEVVAAVKAAAARRKRSYAAELARLKRRVRFSGFRDDGPPTMMLAMRDVMKERAAAEGLSAYAVQSFMSICNELGCMVEYATALVADAGIPVACETDVHGAVSAAMLQAASLDREPVFLADLTVRHPEDDNGILLWHCSAPPSMRDPSCPEEVADHWILPGIPSGSCHWRMKPGDVTILRFDGDRGEYRMAVGEGSVMEGPRTQNTYGWMKVNDWPAWERRFIEGPYIHHVACNCGRYRAALAEAVRFLPGGIVPDLLP